MLHTIRTYLEMIRFSHTVFALPFAFRGAVLAAGGIPHRNTTLWILVAVVGARSGAMGMKHRKLETGSAARDLRAGDRAGRASGRPPRNRGESTVTCPSRLSIAKKPAGEVATFTE